MHKLAVYGTLKQGHNNFWFMKGCKFLGRGETVDKFGMLSYGKDLGPKIYRGYDKGKVAVEVYEVPTELLEGPLDHIENEGKWYKREIVQIQMLNFWEIPNNVVEETEVIDALIYIGLGDPGPDHIGEPNQNGVYNY